MSDTRTPVEKKAPADHAIQPVLADRWSPYAFADREIDEGDLLSLLEAARWAPSSFNEQPWRFFVARRSEREAFERALSCLVEGNRVWAASASALLLTVVSTRFARNDKENRSAFHDVGLAAMCLTSEATARGLAVHQMIGIEPERVRAVYEVPEGFEPLTGIAVGFAGDPEQLTEGLRQRDTARRTRRPLSEFCFGARFGEGWSGLS